MGCCIVQQPDPLTSKEPNIEENKTAPIKSTGISLDDFNIEKVIGKGAFGKVFLVSNKQSGNIFAMKSLRK